jgi:hypothetical protein
LQIAKGLGVQAQRSFVVEMTTRHEGRPVVVLRIGEGKQAAFMKVPPGHLALIRRAYALLPSSPPVLRSSLATMGRLHRAPVDWSPS